jgi:ribose 5-phosphate isomerase
MPRFTEKEISECLGQLLRNIYVPVEVARSIMRVVQRDQKKMLGVADRARARMEAELATVRHQMDQAGLPNNRQSA